MTERFRSLSARSADANGGRVESIQRRGWVWIALWCTLAPTLIAQPVRIGPIGERVEAAWRWRTLPAGLLPRDATTLVACGAHVFALDPSGDVVRIPAVGEARGTKIATGIAVDSTRRYAAALGANRIVVLADREAVIVAVEGGASRAFALAGPPTRPSACGESIFFGVGPTIFRIDPGTSGKPAVVSNAPDEQAGLRIDSVAMFEPNRGIVATNRGFFRVESGAWRKIEGDTTETFAHAAVVGALAHFATDAASGQRKYARVGRQPPKIRGGGGWTSAIRTKDHVIAGTAAGLSIAGPTPVPIVYPVLDLDGEAAHSVAMTRDRMVVATRAGRFLTCDLAASTWRVFRLPKAARPCAGAIARDRDGATLWIGAHAGLVQFDPATGRFDDPTAEVVMKDDTRKPLFDVHAVATSPDGRVWFASRSAAPPGLSMQAGLNVEHYARCNCDAPGDGNAGSLERGRIAFARSAGGEVWFGIERAGDEAAPILARGADKPRLFGATAGLDGTRCLDVAATTDRIVALTDVGVFAYDAGKDRWTRQGRAVRAQCVALGADGRIWVGRGADRVGLLVFDGVEWTARDTAVKVTSIARLEGEDRLFYAGTGGVGEVVGDRAIDYRGRMPARDFEGFVQIGRFIWLASRANGLVRFDRTPAEAAPASVPPVSVPSVSAKRDADEPRPSRWPLMVGVGALTLLGLAFLVARRRGFTPSATSTEADEARYLVENSEFLFCRFGPRGEVRYIDPLLERITGIKSWGTEGDGPTFRDAVHEDDRPVFDDLLAKQKTGDDTDVDVSLRVREAHTGAYRRLFVKHTAVHVDGVIDGYSLVGLDFTELAEDDRLQRESGQKLESLGLLAGSIAHDFNNLLMGILGYAEMASLKVEKDSKVAKLLDEIQGAGDSAARLCQQLLNYAGRGKVEYRPVRLRDVVNEMTDLIRLTVPRSIDVTYDAGAGDAVIEGDLSQLTQVVLNLVTNASDAILAASGGEPKNASIRVATGQAQLTATWLSHPHVVRGEPRPPGPYVFVAVTDSAGALARSGHDLNRLFDPFFTTREKGRGLGLSTVQGIVRGHRGVIRVDPHESETTFGAYFPLTDAPVRERATPRVAPDATWVGSGGVLVVDDNTMACTVAKEALERHGFSVFLAFDGEQALDTFGRHHEQIAAIVLDMNMPRMGGAEVFPALRRQRADLPIVLASGYDEEEAVHFTSEPRTTFLQKPYSSEELGAALRHVMQA